MIILYFSSDEDVHTEPLINLHAVEPEPAQVLAPEVENTSPNERETANTSNEIHTVQSTNASFFTRAIDFVIHINEMTSHIGRILVFKFCLHDYAYTEN